MNVLMLYEIGNFYNNASQAVIQSHKADKSGKILITRLKKMVTYPHLFFSPISKMKSKKFDYCFFLARTRISNYLKGIKFNLVFLKNSRNLTHAKNFKNVKFTKCGRLFPKLF